MSRRPTRCLPFVVAAVLLVPACGATSDDEILVSAAASLTDAFTAVEVAFEAAHPGSDVVLNFGGTAALREQILEGAPVDVFASADLESMETIAAAGLVEGVAVDLVTNRIQIAVPPDNPAGVMTLDDLSDEELLVGLCAPTVPCGSLARDVLLERGIEISVDTEEPDVRSLLTKIETGELDAGLVYRTDVVASDVAVLGIDLPFGIDPRSTYSIAVVSNGSNPVGAGEFLAFLRSMEGEAILTAAGFELP